MEEILPALTAGLVSTIICNPLDTIRINYQLGNKIRYDISYMYRGIHYGLIAIPLFWTFYFPIYKKLKENKIPIPISAYISCCTASTISTPFWVLRQNSQTNKTIPFSINNLYKGLLPTYLLNLSFTVQIPIYEYLKNNEYNIFICTSLSKTISTCIFYPFDTIRARIRDGKIAIKKINYYRGISIYLIRSLPYHISIFCTYEHVKKNLM